MKGPQFSHNFLLAEPCLAALWGIGAVAFREYPTIAKPNPPRVDIFAQWNGYRFVWECENSAQRTDQDMAKAHQLRADLLGFIAPTARVAKAIRRKIRKTTANQGNAKVRIIVVTLAAAQQLLSPAWRIRGGLKL